LDYYFDKIIGSIVLIFMIFVSGNGQERQHTYPRYELNRIYTPLAIEKEDLVAAKLISDINRFYKSDWVEEYISVEVKAFNDGILKRIESLNDTLSKAQKEIMFHSDEGSSISVSIKYMPNNTLKNNSEKIYDFSFIIDPEKKAMYTQGEDAWNLYFKEKALDLIPENSFKDYDVAAIRFTIDEEGEIINGQVFQASKNPEIDALLLETIEKMPCWTPAEYANGKKVKQDYVLMVGSLENCIIGTLNIRKEDRFH